MKRDYFVMLGFLFFSLIGLIYLVFSLRDGFYLELFFTELFILFAIAVIVGFYKERAWAWNSSLVFFILFGVNLFYIRSLINVSLFFGLMGLFCLVGILVSALHSRKEENIDEFKETYEEISKKLDSEEFEVEEIKPKKEGDFVASKNSSVFHIPGCAFVKRVKNIDKLWFKSKAQARGKKYRAHTCLK